MSDPNGLIQPGRPAPGFTLAVHLSPPEVNAGADGILDTLDRLATDRRVVAG